MSWNSKPSTVNDLLNQSLHLPIRDFIDRQGKRIRGDLTELSYKISGGRGHLSEEVCKSIELLHAGSLVIDDIQDCSSQRRGRATMHREIGMPQAMNAGNFMYFRALEVLADSSLPTATRSRLTQEMIRAGRVCHEGQAIDLAARLDGTQPQEWNAIASTITARKTGTLVSLAMTMGSIAAGGSEYLARELQRCGNQIGFALQMRNDLAELATFAAGSTDRCDDLRNHRVTWPWAWLASQYSEQVCCELVKTLLQQDENKSLDGLRSLAVEIVDLVDSIGQHEIERSIDEPLRLLGEHVVEPEFLAAVKRCLTPIRQSSQQSNTVHAHPGKVTL